MRASFSGLIVVCLLTLVTTQISAQNDTSVHLPANYGVMQPPASQLTYVDPAFGTTITRLSDAQHTPDASNGGMLQWIENEYSTANPFTTDNSRLILLHNTYFGLYSGSGAFVGNLPLEISASSEPRWSRVDNNTLYYHMAGGNQLKTYNVATGVTTVIHTFSEYSAIAGKGKTDISYDGDHFILIGDTLSGMGELFIYQISTDTKTVVARNRTPGWNNVFISPDNEAVISWLTPGTARFQGVELYDLHGNFKRQLTHADGHSKMSRDSNGDEVFIWTNSADPLPACGQNAIVKVHMADGVQTCLISLDWSFAVHITAADNTWVFVETYTDPGNDVVPPTGWLPYMDELLQIKMDGSEIRRLVQHRSRPLNSYNYMPKLSASRDGTRLAYASNFGLQLLDGAPQQYGDEYMIAITAPAATVVPGSATVVNGASYQSTVAPGAIISIFGSALASGTQAAPTAPLSATLQNAVVSFNGIPAPLFYVSPTQINAQIPYGLKPGSATMQVTNSGSTAATQTVTVAAAAPGIFTANQTGSGPGLILRSTDYQVVSSSTPAQEGGFILIYCTGLGGITGAIVEGSPAPNPPLNTAILPQVSVGNIAAPVTFSGLAPGFAGLYQVNVQIPAGVPAGNAVPIVLTSNGVSSNTVTIVVQ